MSKVVLITGASSGIGLATARALAAAGYRVFGGARTPDRIAPIANVEFIELDVRNPDHAQRAIDTVVKSAGRIDVLINNAGVSLVGPIEATSDTEAQDLFDTNFFGALRVMRAALPVMRAQKSGLIVNVSSVLGFLPAPFMGLYSASKHALEGVSETLDHEVRGFGVRVVLVEPSFTNTRIDTNATRTQASIAAYDTALQQSSAMVHKQVDQAPSPDAVADRIVKILSGKYRLRQPADGRAKLLSVLRRFAPASQVDKSLRGAFGLSA